MTPIITHSGNNNSSEVNSIVTLSNGGTNSNISSGLEHMRQSGLLDTQSQAVINNSLPSVKNQIISRLGRKGVVQVAAAADNAAIVSYTGTSAKPKFELAHVVHVEGGAELNEDNQSSVYILCAPFFNKDKMSPAEITSVGDSVANVITHRINYGLEGKNGAARTASTPDALLNINGAQFRISPAEMKASADNLGPFYDQFQYFIDSPTVWPALVEGIDGFMRELRQQPMGTKALIVDYIIRESLDKTQNFAHKQVKAACILQALAQYPVMLTKSSHDALVTVLSMPHKDKATEKFAVKAGMKSGSYQAIVNAFLKTAGRRPTLDISLMCLDYMRAPANGLQMDPASSMTSTMTQTQTQTTAQTLHA